MGCFLFFVPRVLFVAFHSSGWQVPERSDMGGPEPESYSENVVVDDTSPNPFVPTAPTAMAALEVQAANEKPDGGNAAV